MFMLKIKKLLFYIFIGYPIYIISFLIKRDHDLWLIGSKDGFRCNSKYYFISHINSSLNSKIKLYWIAKDKNTFNKLTALSLPCVYKYSIKGFIFLLKAKVYITSYGTQFDLSFWTSGNVFKCYLWHGVGIKNIGYLSKKENIRRMYHSKNIFNIVKYYPYREKPNLFLSTSPLMNKHFSEAFNIDKKNIFEGLYPRCEFLLSSKDDVASFINKYEDNEIKGIINQLKCYDKIYFYMPTWRSNKKNIFKFLNWNIEQLNDILIKNNAFLILKLHPMSEYEKSIIEYSNIMILNNNIDPYPILYYTDTLITDYSSVYFDYILLKNKELVLYPFDLEEYTNEEDDLAFDYKEYTPGIYIYTFHDLLEFIDDIYSNNEDSSRKINEIRNIFWGNYESKKSIQLKEKIEKSL
ncbi:CDP-glycerol glycerophosphotransferase family protein [Proteus faecis]|uniref:CDP-glycerol glycerophosphotransferase family protein n=1 Tax=Proteus faecis TaxID=2050967 RepID=UPI000D690F10|nr:CDP-glycerol glycerophosphotransferase family protein [Proteus faecis]